MQNWLLERVHERLYQDAVSRHQKMKKRQEEMIKNSMGDKMRMSGMYHFQTPTAREEVHDVLKNFNTVAFPEESEVVWNARARVDGRLHSNMQRTWNTKPWNKLASPSSRIQNCVSPAMAGISPAAFPRLEGGPVYDVGLSAINIWQTPKHNMENSSSNRAIEAVHRERSKNNDVSQFSMSRAGLYTHLDSRPQLMIGAPRIVQSTKKFTPTSPARLQVALPSLGTSASQPQLPQQRPGLANTASSWSELFHGGDQEAPMTKATLPQVVCRPPPLLALPQDTPKAIEDSKLQLEWPTTC